MSDPKQHYSCIKVEQLLTSLQEVAIDQEVDLVAGERHDVTAVAVAGQQTAPWGLEAVPSAPLRPEKASCSRRPKPMLLT